MPAGCIFIKQKGDTPSQKKTCCIIAESCSDDMSYHVLHTFLESMPGQVHTVIKAKGEHIIRKETCELLSNNAGIIQVSGFDTNVWSPCQLECIFTKQKGNKPSEKPSGLMLNHAGMT